jgi:hypothetical protein
MEASFAWGATLESTQTIGRRPARTMPQRAHQHRPRRPQHLSQPLPPPVCRRRIQPVRHCRQPLRQLRGRHPSAPPGRSFTTMTMATGTIGIKITKDKRSTCVSRVQMAVGACRHKQGPNALNAKRADSVRALENRRGVTVNAQLGVSAHRPAAPSAPHADLGGSPLFRARAGAPYAPLASTQISQRRATNTPELRLAWLARRASRQPVMALCHRGTAISYLCTRLQQHQVRPGTQRQSRPSGQRHLQRHILRPGLPGHQRPRFAQR